MNVKSKQGLVYALQLCDLSTPPLKPWKDIIKGVEKETSNVPINRLEIRKQQDTQIEI
mgnify:CR=1 FL=1